MEASDQDSQEENPEAEPQTQQPSLTPEQRQKLQDQLANQQRFKHYLKSVLTEFWSVEAIAYIQEHDPDLKNQGLAP